MTALRRGWCPGVFEPMPSGDGLLVRIKPRLAMLTIQQARALAAASSRFGNGVLMLTNRANVQVRGLRAATVEPFARAMLEAGLVSDDPRIERARNVIVSPLAGDDPSIAPGTADAARQAEALLAWLAQRGDLPPKFAIAIDGGGVLPLGSVAAPLTLVLHGGANAGAALPQVGTIEYADSRGAIGASPAFGMLSSETLAGLAELADRFGDSTLRVSPHRAVLLAGVAAENFSRVARCVELLDLIVNPADPRLRVTACIGAPACARASIATRDAAAHVAALPTAMTVHVSGCAKGCAHPSAAPLTLVGRNGRFDIVRNGRAGDVPAVTGRTLAEVVAWIAG